MFKRLTSLLSLTLVIFLAILTFAPAVSSDVQFYVYPIKLEMPAAPGESLTKTIKIQNQNTDPLKIRTYVMDYEISKNNDFTFHPPGYESYSAAKWISLDKADFSIAPGKEQEVQVTLKVPKDAEPSGHYAVIFFESVAEKLEKGTSGVVAQGRIGTLVLQSTPGKEKVKGDIKQFDIPTFYFVPPQQLFLGGKISVPWAMTFHNGGNVHLNLETRVTFVNWQGESVKSTKPLRITALPNTDREIKGTWDNAPGVGRFKAICKVAYADGRIATKSVNIYIIPTATLALAIIVVVLLVLIFFFAYRLGRRKQEES